MVVRRGIIMGFKGSWFSGLATIEMEVDGVIEQVPCQNAPTVRVMEEMFGGVIGEGHSVKPEGNHLGQEVMFSTDEFGVLLGMAYIQ